MDHSRIAPLAVALVAGAVCAGPSALLAKPAACAGKAEVAATAKAWLAKRPQTDLKPNLAHAACFRNALLKRLGLGPVVGYKIGIYSAAARATWHADKPAVGVLLRDMLQPPGKPVSVRFAYSPMAEADFILVMGDEGINDAATPAEAYRHVRGYRPFIELPDNNVPADAPSDLARLIALDVNARKGIYGPEVALPQSEAALNALEALKVTETIATPSGTKRNEAEARQTLGDPLQILLDTRDLLAAEGIRLAAGDLISLGTITPAHRPAAGETFTVAYEIEGHRSEMRQVFQK